MSTSTAVKKEDFVTKTEFISLRDDMNYKFERLENKIDEKFTELTDIMVQSFHFVYDRFDKIDARFEKIDGRMGSFDKRMEEFEKRLDGFDSRLNSVNTRLDSVILDTPRGTEHNKLVARVAVLEKKK